MSAALDYLRLATWDGTQYTHTIAELRSMYPDDWIPSGWLQYKGQKRGAIFYGIGEQKGIRHYVINVSGHVADRVVKEMRFDDTWYATRLDLQMTLPKPLGGNLPEVYARINQHVRSSIIQSHDNDTLYVGVRTSDVFTRLYEKPLDIMYLRLEFELKGRRSRACWHALNTGSEIDEVFAYYLGRSKLPVDVTEQYKLPDVNETQKAMREEIKKDDENTLKWLMSIDGAMMRALNNHNIGQRVSIIVESWANVSSNIDRMNEKD